MGNSTRSCLDSSTGSSIGITTRDPAGEQPRQNRWVKVSVCRLVDRHGDSSERKLGIIHSAAPIPSLSLPLFPTTDNHIMQFSMIIYRIRNPQGHHYRSCRESQHITGNSLGTRSGKLFSLSLPKRLLPNHSELD